MPTPKKAKPRRKVVFLTIAVSLRPGITVAHAKREVRTRVNDLTEHHCFRPDRSQAEESDVRIKRVASAR
jgi:hypothetical protein